MPPVPPVPLELLVVVLLELLVLLDIVPDPPFPPVPPVPVLVPLKSIPPPRMLKHPDASTVTPGTTSQARFIPIVFIRTSPSARRTRARPWA